MVKILVVDDEFVTAGWQAVFDEGFELQMADSPDSALKLARTGGFDVLLINRYSEGTDPSDLFGTQALKATKIPVKMMLTATLVTPEGHMPDWKLDTATDTYVFTKPTPARTSASVY